MASEGGYTLEHTVELENVSKTYGEHNVRALVDINLKVRAGQFVAIMGPSGCGKSTLLNLIGGIDRPSSGTIQLNGRPISLLQDEQLTLLRRSEIGFVFQFFNLLSTLTVEENVALPLELNKAGNSKQIKERVRSMLDQVGIQARSDFYPATLSGGEMQRTAIARALIHSPWLIVADEPTGNLDSENGKAVLELLSSTSLFSRQTIIMATHSAEAAAYADRIVEMKDGSIIGEKQQCRKR